MQTLALLMVMVACGGPVLSGQHAECTSNDDCGDDSLECLTSDGGLSTCEVSCTSGDTCPLEQTCENIGVYGEGVGVCYEMGA